MPPDCTQHSIEIDDGVLGDSGRPLKSMAHLVPGCAAASDNFHAVLASSADTRRHLVEFNGAEAVKVELGGISSQHAVREPALLIHASVTSDLPISISYRIGSA